MTEFKAYPKTPRLFRDVVVTEKIDGSNAGIQIIPVSDGVNGPDICWSATEDTKMRVVAQSRKRIIVPGDDNFGFAKWVQENQVGLATHLGEGTHYGEWWGSGIQRGYGLPKGEKRFSLFNVKRWGQVDLTAVPGLHVVPTLYEGPFDQDVINSLVDELRRDGSFAPGLLNRGFHAEGVIVFHSASGQVYKVLCENDEIPKGLVA